MSFIDNIKEEIQSTYIIGTFHREGSRGYFDDLRGTAGERIEGLTDKIMWASQQLVSLP